MPPAWPQPRTSAGGHRSRRPGPARGLSMAGQCPGAPERHRARLRARRRADRAPTRPPGARSRARPPRTEHGSGRPHVPRSPRELAPGVGSRVPEGSPPATRRERLAGRQGGGAGPEDAPRAPGQVRGQPVAGGTAPRRTATVVDRRLRVAASGAAGMIQATAVGTGLGRTAARVDRARGLSSTARRPWSCAASITALRVPPP